MKASVVQKVAFIGNHTPRQCGLATFTADVSSAVAGQGVETQVVAMNDKIEGYDYPEVVSFQVDQNRQESYIEAAQFLNTQHLDVVCVQHEYGIFGGPAGAYLLNLLREVNAPIVTTLHTILRDPTPDQRQVLSDLAQLSERLIVMTQTGQSILEEVHGIERSKIKIIPHGIPSVNRQAPDEFLAKLDLTGKRVILTFGLIAPDKGIEDMVRALPEIVADHPDVYYLVVGATHPNIRAQHGEAYRQHLVQLASELGVADNIGFIDRFVSIEDLTDYLQAASIYVTPYLKKEQITSGTLAYAFGSGKAVVSTPYWHAEELLANGRGILVPFKDPGALASKISWLLSNPVQLEVIQSTAYTAGAKMQWPVVGAEYVRVFAEARESSRSILPDLSLTTLPIDLDPPMEQELNLDHLLAITDDTGILQHCTYSVPNRFEGYCTDDNARLAIVGTRLEDSLSHAKLGIWFQHKALSFLHHALNEQTGRMRNFMSYDRKWLEEHGSEDSHGRAVWALGVLSDESSVAAIREHARDILKKCLPALTTFTSPRAYAFAILGLDRALASTYCDECMRTVRVLAGRLNGLFERHSDANWPWFEHVLAYDNARLPQALMAAGFLLDNEDMVDNATTALNWLVEVQTDPSGCFLPIGSNNFYTKNGERSRHDQQPLEATATVEACFDAYILTDDPRWQNEAMKAHAWFRGANTERRSLIDDETGGCRDGLTECGVNQNQGAESSLAYVAATLAAQQLEMVAVTRQKRYLG